MASQLTLGVINQSAQAMAVLAIRELIQPAGAQVDSAAVTFEAGSSQPNESETWTRADVASFLGVLTALMVGGVWSFGWLGSVAWWLVTGRGPGGRLLAAGSVAPPAFRFRAWRRPRRARG